MFVFRSDATVLHRTLFRRLRLRLARERADDTPRKPRVFVEAVAREPVAQAALARHKVHGRLLPPEYLGLVECELDLAHVDGARREGAVLALLEVVAAIHDARRVHAVAYAEAVRGLVAQHHPAAAEEARRLRGHTVGVARKREEADSLGSRE